MIQQNNEIYSETSGNLWQYYRDEPALTNNNTIINSPANNNNVILFEFKEKITRQTGTNGTKDIERRM